MRELDTATAAKLVRVNETVTLTTRITSADIIAFANTSLDMNPLHIDAQAAARAGFPTIIASGQHSSALLMGLLATHFSRSDDGIAREMLCLNMNFSFKEPVFAERDLSLFWRVTSVEWKSRLGGQLAQLDGTASQGSSRIAVIARGTILVKPASQSDQDPPLSSATEFGGLGKG